jgi:uncharacterized protein (DUF2126 family)
MSFARYGEERMSLSWISNRSLKVSPRVRLVEDAEADALRRKLESIEWRPQNGFLKDEVIEKTPLSGSRAARAA